MKIQKNTIENPELLLDNLGSTDGNVRKRTRELLMKKGRAGIVFLAGILRSSDIEQVRWEAARALSDMNDAATILPLVAALEDSFTDVAWMAAAGLKKYKMRAWPALLRSLIKNGPKSVLLRHGIHHVLKDQKEEGFDDLLTVISGELATETVPELSLSAAHDILKRMKLKPPVLITPADK